MPISITDLPTEILEAIAEFCSIVNNVTALNCNTRKAAISGLIGLKALSQSCRRLYQILVPILYRAVWIKDNQSIKSLSRTLISRPELAKHTQAVHVFYSSNVIRDSDVQFLKNLPSLRHLYFDCDSGAIHWDNKEGEYWDELWPEKIYPKLPSLGLLSCLQSCFFDLRIKYREFWSIEDAWHLLAHPTLEILYLNYVSTDEISANNLVWSSHGKVISLLGSTVLKELHFFNSDITPNGLMVLLQIPKNLKVLTMSDPYCDSKIDEHDPFSTGDYLREMRDVTSSLEFLWIWEQDLDIFPGPAYGLSNFTSLRVLDVNSGNLFGRDGIETSEVEESEFETIIAPNIEVLRIRHLEKGHEGYLLEFAKRQPELCPRLRKLIIDRDGKDQTDGSTEEWCATLKESGVEVVSEISMPYSAKELKPPQPNPLWSYIDGNFWRP